AQKPATRGPALAHIAIRYFMPPLLLFSGPNSLTDSSKLQTRSRKVRSQNHGHARLSGRYCIRRGLIWEYIWDDMWGVRSSHCRGDFCLSWFRWSTLALILALM